MLTAHGAGMRTPAPADRQRRGVHCLDGMAKEGRTDSGGIARLEGIVPGECQVVLVDDGKDPEAYLQRGIDAPEYESEVADRTTLNIERAMTTVHYKCETSAGPRTYSTGQRHNLTLGKLSVTEVTGPDEVRPGRAAVVSERVPRARRRPLADKDGSRASLTSTRAPCQRAAGSRPDPHPGSGPSGSVSSRIEPFCQTNERLRSPAPSP